MRVSSNVLREIRRIQIRTRKLVQGKLLGAYRSAFKGHGIEFEEVRAFQPGDEIRNINWHVSARMNQPFVKQFREERELTIMLVVDISASAQFGSGKRSKGEIMAELGALLALSAIDNRDRVGLLLFSNRVEKYIPPSRGPKQALRIIRELLTTRTEQRGTDLQKALIYLTRLQRKPAVCFIISDFLTENGENALKIVAKRYDCIAIRVLDPHEVKFPNVGLVRLRDLETGIERLLDSQHMQKAFNSRSAEELAAQDTMFKRLEIGLIDLPTDDSYADALRRYFHERKRQR